MRKLKRSECAVLPLVLKGKWFDMIDHGGKREEYRNAIRYWHVRFHNWDRRTNKNVAPIVEFRRGYSASAPRMAFWVLAAETESGLRTYGARDGALHPEWGEPRGLHFVIFLGGRIELEGGK